MQSRVIILRITNLPLFLFLFLLVLSFQLRRAKFSNKHTWVCIKKKNKTFRIRQSVLPFPYGVAWALLRSRGLHHPERPRFWTLAFAKCEIRLPPGQTQRKQLPTLGEPVMREVQTVDTYETTIRRRSCLIWPVVDTPPQPLYIAHA